MWLITLATAALPTWLVATGEAPAGDGIFFTLFFLTFATTGLVLIWRVPDNRVAWVYAAAGVLGGIHMASFSYAVVGLDQGWPLATDMAVLSSILYFPWIVTTVSLPILLFPDGELPSRRWRWVRRAIWSVYVISILSNVTGDDPSHGEFEGMANPWQIESLGWVGDLPFLGLITMGVLLTALVGPPLALIQRFWRSSGEERLQLKWLALSASVAGLGLVATYALGAYHETWWLSVITNLALFGALMIPVTTGMAIVRYRLYDIDRLISRTMVYGLLVALLAGVYLGLVFALSQVLPNDDSITVAISTLAVAALFNPLRRRIQGFIDRRLYRSQYDAREIVEDFSERLQDDVEFETIEDELLTVIDETVKPEAAGLWIREQR